MRAFYLSGRHSIDATFIMLLVLSSVRLPIVLKLGETVIALRSTGEIQF